MAMTGPAPLHWLRGDGDMVRRIREHDWNSTPLGRPEHWPASLRVALGLILESPLPSILAWGAELTTFYNDAYRPLLGGKPEALGRPMLEVWGEARAIIAPQIERALAGDAIRFEHARFTILRSDKPEEAFFDYTYNAVRDETGAVVGLLNTAVETTRRELAERERAGALEALRASEERLSTVLEGVDEPFYVLDGEWRFLFASRSALRLWGKETDEILGRTLLDAFPQASGSDIYEAHRRVMRTRNAERVETFSAVLHHWIELDIAPTRHGGLSVGFRSIEARRQAEQRQAFLLKLSDATRPLTDPVAIQETASRLLAEHLGADRAMYSEFEGEGAARLVFIHGQYIREGEPFPSPVSYAAFVGGRAGDALRIGGTLVIEDASRDELLDADARKVWLSADIAAVIAVGLVKNGRETAHFGVNSKMPRGWMAGEIELVHEVAERTWAAAERARAEAALSKSEARFQLILQSMSDAVYVGTASGITVANAAALEQLGYDSREQLNRDIGALAREIQTRDYLTGATISAEDQAFARALRGEEVIQEVSITNLRTGKERVVRCAASPLVENGRVVAAVAVNTDVTELKRNEKALRESDERQAFLLRLSDELGPLADPADIQGKAAHLLGEWLDVGWCYYNEFDETGTTATVLRDFAKPGLPSLVGVHDLSDVPDFTGIVGAGNLFIMPDLATSPLFNARVVTRYTALGMQSALGVPLVKEGKLISLLLVADTRVRTWTEAEVTLLRDVAERTWSAVEQARAEAALRESEARMRQFGDASQHVLSIRDVEKLQWTYLTPAFETIYGLTRDEALHGDNFRSWLELIVAEDRATAIDAIRKVRAGEHVTFDYRIRRPVDGAVRWLRNTDFPIVNPLGEVTLIGGIGHDLTELRAAERRLQTLMEGIPQLVWRAVDNGSRTWTSPQWTAYTGQSERDSQGWGWLDAVHPDDRPLARNTWSHAIEQGGFEVEHRVRNATNNDYRWFKTRATPVRNEGGVIVEWLGTSTDIHDLRDLQARQQVLVAELQHRTRNLMSVVRSMADKTARASADVPDFRARFGDRLEALARVQGLLSRLNEHDRVTFDQLIHTELAAMGGASEKVVLDGPIDVRLRSSTVQILAMALHELATNAVKYGALGQSNAQLAVKWSFERAEVGDKPWLTIDWRESGVAMPSLDSAPRGTGQGRELIEQALPYQLWAKTTYKLGADGVHCTISIPVSDSSDWREDSRG